VSVAPADAAVAAVSLDAADPIVESSPDAGTPTRPRVATAPGALHPDHPRPKPDAGQTAQTGTLIVKVKPYAEVYIDHASASAGTTPVRQVLSAGAHQIVLVGAEQREEVTVTVNPSKETIISRNW
jgi:hypothetical protein